MNEDNETKYFTKTLLLEAINAAKREGRRCIIPKDLIMACDDDFIFVVHRAYFHNKHEMRLSLAIDFTPQIHMIDVGMTRYNSLPVSRTDRFGNILFENVETTTKKRPYGAGREFEEKFRIKPLRKFNFRKMVLDAYESKCCICDVGAPLVAAHIVPVAKGGRDTIDNGILLCKNHDHLFEFGQIQITPDGEIICENDSLCSVDKMRYPYASHLYPLPDNFRRKIELLNQK